MHVIRCINGDRKHLFQIVIIISSPSLLSLLSSPSFCSVSSPSLSLFLLSLPPLRRPSFLLPCSSLSVFGEAAQIKLGSCGWSACFSQCFPIALCTCTVFFCAFVGVVFNIVLVMCQLSCCCSGLSCLHVVRWCVGMVHFVFCVFHNHLCLIQPLCQIQPLCAFQSSGRNNG